MGLIGASNETADIFYALYPFGMSIAKYNVCTVLTMVVIDVWEISNLTRRRARRGVIGIINYPYI